MLTEVCVTSIASIKNATAAGADRVELCSALGVGGVTPSYGLIKRAVNLNALPIHCLIRPREGHFTYSPEEVAIIEQDILVAKDLGCSGVVIGALTPEFHLDLVRLEKWRAIAGSMYLTFHRAFDVVREPMSALKQLIELGFDCVLSSGQKEKAEEGFSKLEIWNKTYGNQIAIMPGSGINSSNCSISSLRLVITLLATLSLRNSLRIIPLKVSVSSGRALITEAGLPSPVFQAAKILIF